MERDERGHRANLAAIARQAMIERGLEPDFPPEVRREVAGIASPARAGDSLRDLRELLWASIDNDDSRDLDQLTVAAELPGGRVRILVAVADVDALVERGTAIDGHAARNTTSVYTAGAIFPMLPLELSTGFTSLNEAEERIALVVDMVLGSDGALAEADLYRARVLNHAKLAYRSVAAWLDGAAPPPPKVGNVPGLDEQLRLQDRIAERLHDLRHLHGALGLETIEARPVFDGDLLTDLEVDPKDRAKQIIEDFMIAANGATASFLESRHYPTVRRVLRAPERWGRIVDLASTLGEKLPAEPEAVALETFLAKRKKADPVGFPDLSLAVVKLIGKGEYVLDLPGNEPPGHFGLAVRDYAHSTAPNRRFPDLITQRLVKSALSGSAVPYTAPELSSLAEHCTLKEDDAAKVERRVRKSAGALLLERRVGERFDAIVTGASPKGTWVRLLRPPVEGRVERGSQGLDVGDRVRVQLISTDVERGFVDFARA
ncbi:MAG: RNB domain-containing ribonuclease [Acidobacteriia bacterium]|nr:RNB domain-containing ribonuclease [Terriglobia bacterium]